MDNDAIMTRKLRLGGIDTLDRLGFGAMRLPTQGFHGPPRDPKTGRAVLRRAVELGVDHIDTADFYRSGDGTVRANVLIREALHPYPAGLVIATKVGPIFGPRGPRPAQPAELRGLVEANLESLGLDQLALVYLRVGMMEGPPHGESIARRKSSRPESDPGGWPAAGPAPPALPAAAGVVTAARRGSGASGAAGCEIGAGTGTGSMRSSSIVVLLCRRPPALGTQARRWHRAAIPLLRLSPVHSVRL